MSCSAGFISVPRATRQRLAFIRFSSRGWRLLYLDGGDNEPMTYLDVAYRYGATPGEREMRAIDGMREVYGIRKVDFKEKDRTVRVEFDASRLTEDSVAKLLRQAGIDVRDRLALA
jgi:hypothetical protein